VCIVAPHILYVNIGCVGLGREAIIAHVQLSIGNSKAVNLVRIKTIGILGTRIAGRKGVKPATIESYIICANKECTPARRVQEFYSGDFDVGGIVGHEEYWAQEDIVLILGCRSLVTS
jgi:hypothetical protein